MDTTAIERILPHRYPFLLVDKITEFEPDQRIVGVKNVSLNEPYLSRPECGRPSLPPTILYAGNSALRAQIASLFENAANVIFAENVSHNRCSDRGRRS